MAEPLPRPVIWFYGPSGSGKSCAAGIATEVFAGPCIDEAPTRRLAFPGYDGSAVDRLKLTRMVAGFARQAAEDTENYPGPAAWVASEALYAENRLAARQILGDDVRFVLMDSPLDLCRDRAENPVDRPDREPRPDLVLDEGLDDFETWLPCISQLLHTKQ
jgi:adenylylsulfate kinase-like enzyme